MKLLFKNIKCDVLFLIRRAGYGLERINKETGEYVFGRRFGGRQYPKFHIYARKEGDDLTVNLHLDQKKPVYSGVSAHSGEYDGEVVEQEAGRVKILIDKAIRAKI